MGWIAICFTAAASGAPFAPDDWYAQLIRPAFAPPDFVFGPVWSILYLSMAAAAWMVWKRDRLRNTWRPLRIRVVAGGVTIADSTNTKRVLETSHPPVYYIPPHDIETDCLLVAHGKSFCEWKGEAEYYAIVAGGKTFEQSYSFRCPH